MSSEIPADLEHYVRHMPPRDREVLQVLMEHAASNGLSALEMKVAVDKAGDVFLAMHEAMHGKMPPL